MIYDIGIDIGSADILASISMYRIGISAKGPYRSFTMNL